MSLLDAKLRENLDYFIKHVQKLKACIIIIDGGLGVGKTSTAITIAKEIQPNFDEAKQVGRGTEQFTEAWEYTEKEVKVKRNGIKVCVFDEAQDFDRANHATKRNRALKMFFNTFRDSKTLLILCLPHFRRLDVSIYETRAVQMLLHLDEQFSGYVEGRAYDLESLLRMLDYLHRNRNDKHLSGLNVYKKGGWSNFYFRVKKVSAEEQKKQDRASNSGKRKLRRKSLKQAREE